MENLKIKDTITTIVLGLLLCVVIQFMNLQVYWSLAVFLVVAVSPLLLNKKVYCVPVGQLFFLMMAMTTYFLIFKKSNSAIMYHYVVYFIGPVIFYLAGMYLMALNKKDYEEWRNS